MQKGTLCLVALLSTIDGTRGPWHQTTKPQSAPASSCPFHGLLLPRGGWHKLGPEGDPTEKAGGPKAVRELHQRVNNASILTMVWISWEKEHILFFKGTIWRPHGGELGSGCGIIKLTKSYAATTDGSHQLSHVGGRKSWGKIPSDPCFPITNKDVILHC